MQNLFNNTDEELLNLIKEQSEIGDDLIVVGRFVNYKDKDSFINIRNKNFVPLTYVGQGNEHLGKKVKIEIRERHTHFLEKEWYEFKIKLCDKWLRLKLENPTLITIDLSYEPKLYQPNEREFVLNLYKRKSNQSLETDRGNIQSLRIIEREINRVKEAFIYELLQNADDYPVPNKKVDVNIYTTTNEFIFSHNGSPFKFNNVYALCNINDGDKQDDANKIGYKGIGFKSVFAYSEKVLVKSGKYIFKFDKKHHEFQREKPFQIIPIWIENLSALKELPLKENVNIVIEAKQSKIQIDEWKELLKDIFLQESSTPVILFLRNIRNVFIDKSLVSQTSREWWISEYKLRLSEEIKSEIKRHFETNTGNIPEKLVGVEEIEIQFALKHLDYEIIPLSEAILYNYLPTKVNLGFNFLVNSDFIPTGDRHYLFENEWNKYLMYEVGRKFFDWLNTLFIVKHGTTKQTIFKKDYLKLLPSISKNIQDLKSKTSNNLFLLEAFKQGFDLSVKGNENSPAIPFIPTQLGDIETLSNILIDETGLVDLLKEEFFELTGINKKLIHSEVGEGEEKIKELITEHEQGIIYKIKDLKTNLEKMEFQEWLKNPSNNFKLIQHFNSKTELQSLLETEEIILSENKRLLRASSLFNSVPTEVTFLSAEKVNDELASLLRENKFSLALTEFEPVQFYKGNILDKHNLLNESLQDENNLLNFWRFIFDNWTLFESDTTIKDSFKHFEVLCKSEKGLFKKVISAVYLSAEFYSANEIESVVKDISPDEVFISDKYIDKKREAEKWKKIFKQAGAITDLQKVIEELLPKLPRIKEEKHVEIAKQIFKYWKDPANKLTDIQLGLIKSNLKIKCIDNNYRNTTDCILSDHYNINQLISSWLPEIELDNEVSQEYAPRTNQVAEWKVFLKLIGCIELIDKQNVFDAKIKYLVKNQELCRENHFEILHKLSQLYKERNDNNFSFELLPEFNLKTSTDEWLPPNQVHFSSIYKPDLDLQADEDIKGSYKFLNEKYKPQEINKSLLFALGVNSSFQFSQVELKHPEIPTSYREAFEKKQPRILQNANQGWANQHRIINHIILLYSELILISGYNKIFWDNVVKTNSVFIKYLFQESEYRYYFGPVTLENYVIVYLKATCSFPNQENELKKPGELFSYSLSEYITDKKFLPKYDLSKIYHDNDLSKSLEGVLEFKRFLTQEHCIELLSRLNNRLTIEKIKELQIIPILSNYVPTVEEKNRLFLLNENCEWRPLYELSFSFDEQFEIDPSQHLHEDFMPIAKNFGIRELSENIFTLITEPSSPSCKEEAIAFFEKYAIHIAFKIDETNYPEIKSDIIRKINDYKFYEVTEITKVFSEANPIFKKAIDFYVDSGNKIFYKDYWSSNKELIDYLVTDLLENKIKRNWLIKLLNRWSEKEIIDDLQANSNGNLPPELVDKDPSNIKDEFWEELTDEDETFIKDIIKGEYELNEQLDANTTAKIKTLMTIKDNYNQSEISDEGRYLKAGSDEILVRSAQKGLLYLDLYHWGRLNDYNVKISVYTNNQITIFNSQEELFNFCQPQNKFGVLRMPDDYTLDDYNSLDNITEKGKWHFVFIVNENAKAAKQYKEIIDLDEYNNYG